MGFFNKFKKAFKSAEHDIAKVARAPAELFRPLVDNPIANTLRDNPAVQFLGDHLNPQKAIQNVIDNPKKAGEIAEVLGGVLSAVGLPEIGVPLAIAGGALEGTVIGAEQVATGIEEGDIKAITSGFGKLGESIRGVKQELGIDFQKLDILEKQENQKLTKIINQTKQVARFVKDVDKQLGITNSLLKQEIQGDKTHNDQMKQFIMENHGDNEAIKHNQLVLDKELQKVEQIEEEQEDTLNQIKSIIDRPVNEFDLVKDIENFIEPRAILEYLAENLDTLSSLSTSERDQLLDLAILKGALMAI